MSEVDTPRRVGKMSETPLLFLWSVWRDWFTVEGNVSTPWEATRKAFSLVSVCCAVCYTDTSGVAVGKPCLKVSRGGVR